MLKAPRPCSGPAAEQGLEADLQAGSCEQDLNGDRLELPGGGQHRSIEPTQLAERGRAGLAQTEFARSSPGRAPNRDFSFPSYISPVATDVDLLFGPLPGCQPIGGTLNEWYAVVMAPLSGGLAALRG